MSFSTNSQQLDKKIEDFIRFKPLKAFQMLCREGHVFEGIDRSDAKAYSEKNSTQLKKRYIPTILLSVSTGLISAKTLSNKGILKFITCIYLSSLAFGVGQYITRNWGESEKLAMFEITRKYGDWTNDPLVIQYIKKQSLT